MKSLGGLLASAWSTRRGRASLTLLACMTGVGTYLGAGGSIGGYGAAEASAAVAHMAGVPDPMALMASRSPGARDGAMLRNTKTARHREAVHPHERVLTGAREREEEWPGYDGIAMEPPLYLRDLPFEPGAPGGLVPLEFGGPSVGGGGGFFPGFPIGTPIGGGGGGGGFLPGVPGTPGTPDTPVVTPVPEPATWMSMILGFGLVGASLRRSARRSRARVQA